MLCSNSFAQSGKWELQNSHDGIEVYSRILSCETSGFNLPLENIVFKIVNTNSIKKKIDLRYEIYFQEGCNGCEGDNETSEIIQLKGGESIESTCSNSNGLKSFTVNNPNFSGAWHYTHSLVKIQTTN